MTDKRGFTLIEIIVVMIIVGILAAAAIPSYLNSIQQGAAKSAQNNLISIYNAQKNYYFNNSNYCISSKGICNSTASTNTTLSLNITDTNFTYTCNTDLTGFVCYATNNSDGNFYLTLKNNPVVSTGATGCATSTGASCNPICASDNTAYCPTN